jgi:hypothetical protein
MAVTNFTLPREAQEQSDLAEQLHAQLFPTEELPPNEVLDVPPNGEVVEPPSAATEVTPEAPPVEIPPVDEEDKYRDRYMSLKGKYDAEVPRLAKELRDLREKLEQRPTEQAPPQENPLNARIEKLRNEYGDEFIEDWKALIQSEVQTAIEPIKTKAQTVEETQDELSKREFIQKVTQNAPEGWENLWDTYVSVSNGLPAVEPKFAEFLDKKDPNGFYTYREILEQANTNWDAVKMAKVYSIFNETTKVAAPAAPQTPLVPPTPPVVPSREALVAPSRSSSQPTPSPDDTRIWTNDQIKQFQVDDRNGKYSKEESEALWNDLMLAPSQGRIR